MIETVPGFGQGPFLRFGANEAVSIRLSLALAPP